MRCLTLANALSISGETCVFVSRTILPILADQIRRSGFELVLLEKAHSKNESSLTHASWLDAAWQEDAEQTSEAAHKWHVEWIFVDHYAIDVNWEKRVANGGRKIAVIDDLADRKHYCQMLVDQNLHTYPLELYRPLTPANCELLIGPKYALLRPEFSQWQDQKRPFNRKAVTYLVAFSGTDGAKLTRLTLQVLAEVCGTADRICVVVNSHNIELLVIRNICAEKCYELHIDANNMAELMSGVDISIGAGGGMLWERAALGVPSVAIAVAENQKLQVSRASALGLVLGCDFGDLSVDVLRKMLGRLRDDVTLRERMSKTCRATVDGRGAHRVTVRLLANRVGS